MSVSDGFTKLKEQVENADRSIRAAVAQDDAELKDKVDEARKNADEREDQLRSKSSEAAGEGETERQWSKVRSDWDQHVTRIRERIDADKATIDPSPAEQDAASTESDAIDAMEFAGDAIQEAQYAVLVALRARRKAEAMAAANG
jgi:hypothetical protein